MTIAMTLQIISGFTQRFRSRRPIYKKLVNPAVNKFFHASLVMVFYLVIVFHVLHGLGIT
jgi:p-aminobenzoyl-glutamate transporter AbgT